MVVVAVIAVVGAALIAVGASRLGHYLARHRGTPDAGPAVGTAAGVVFSFFILTPAFLLASSAQDLAVARKGNHAEAGALIDLYLAADRMPAQSPLPSTAAPAPCGKGSPPGRSATTPASR